MSESAGTKKGKTTKKTKDIVTLHDAYALDPKICAEGKLMEFEGSDSWFRVKPAHPDYNPEYRDALEAELQRLEAKGITLDKVNWNEIGMTLAHVCISDWGNMLDPVTRKKLKLNRTNAKKVLEDIPTVHRDVAILAAKMAEFSYSRNKNSLKH